MVSGELVRPRLEARLRRLPPGSVGVVVAPAGSGKTTLLRQATESSDAPVAWLPVDRRCSDVPTFLTRLRAACLPLGVAQNARWASPEDAASELSAMRGGPAVLVVDDVHGASGLAAIEPLRELLEHQPTQLTVLLASRTPLTTVLVRRRLAGDVVEIDAEQLRFRLWEIDELFARAYDMELTWEEARLLADRTGGWAAGLRMACLATRQGERGSRLALLRTLPGGPRLVREYLSTLVLDAVTDVDRDFLLRSSVFDEMTGERCDQLLGVDGSALRLAGLEQRGLFVERCLDGMSFRYHDALRAHLLQTLTDELGASSAADLHRRAADLLQSEGAPDDALKALIRAADWRRAARLLGQTGAALAARPGDWLDALPAFVRDSDAWCGVAVARAFAADGAFARAADAYRRVTERFADEPGGWQAHDELRKVELWADRDHPGGRHWLNRLRLAVDQPHRVLDDQTAPTTSLDLLISAVGHLVAGCIGRALTLFDAALAQPDLSPPVACGAHAGRALSAYLAGDPVAAAESAFRCRRIADELGWPAVQRAASALTTLTDRDGGEFEAPLDHLVRACDAVDDPWGAALVSFFAALSAHEKHHEVSRFVDARRRLLDVGAGALADWVTVLGLVVSKPSDAGRDELEQAANRTERRGQGLVDAIWLLTQGPTGRRLARSVGAAAGASDYLDSLSQGRGWRPDADVNGAALDVHCCGGLRVEVAGRELSKSGLSPRNLEVLRYLCVHAGEAVPVERLTDAIWPATDPDRARHSLHTAVSALRRHLQRESRCSQQFVLYDADTYLLQVGSSDVRELRDQLHTLPRHQLTGSDESAYWRVIDAYREEILPEAGAVDWLVDVREELHAAVADAVATLSGSLLAASNFSAAARAAARGLEFAPYDDVLWRALVHAHTSAGNVLAARAARRHYDALLGEAATG